MKKFIISLITFSFILSMFYNISQVNAMEDINIYNHSYGEILKMTDEKLYDTLSLDEKNYFQSIPASKVLGQTEPKESKDEIIYDNSHKNTNSREASLIVVLTQAKLSRKNNKTLTYGGVYSSTYPIKIKGYAYLIRKRDGHIMKSASCSADSSVSKTLTKDASITKGDDKYYCRATGIYTSKTMGSKTTSQSTISYN